jgi:hypothetical protein
MPSFPVPPWLSWQLQVMPQVVTDFRRPFYICPSNNLPGGPQSRPARIVKPAVIVHIPKQTKREALINASNGTVMPEGLKVTD